MCGGGCPRCDEVGIVHCNKMGHCIEMRFGNGMGLVKRMRPCIGMEHCFGLAFWGGLHLAGEEYGFDNGIRMGKGKEWERNSTPHVRMCLSTKDFRELMVMICMWIQVNEFSINHIFSWLCRLVRVIYNDQVYSNFRVMVEVFKCIWLNWSQVDQLWSTTRGAGVSPCCLALIHWRTPKLRCSTTKSTSENTARNVHVWMINIGIAHLNNRTCTICVY